MNVASIRSRDFKTEDFTEEEVTAMKRDASPSATLGKVRRDAGLGGDVVVRGDDKSTAELKMDWDAHEFCDAGSGGAVDLVIEGTEGTLLHGLGAPLLFAYHQLKTLSEAEEHKDELVLARERGAAHLAMLTAIDVPQCYKNEQIGKWQDAGIASRSGAERMATALETVDKKEAALLQLHADRGMTAARGLIEAGLITREDSSGGDVARAVERDPALKARYEADAAFRAGFDGLVSAKKHDAPAYDGALKNLEARDARYTQHAIAVRG